MSQATLHTSMGAIGVELFDDHAPKTVAMALITSKFRVTREASPSAAISGRCRSYAASNRITDWCSRA